MNAIAPFATTLSCEKLSLPKNTMTALCSEYLIDSAPKRSQHRIDALRWNFARFVLPHFGEQTFVTRIKTDDVESFILAQKRRLLARKRQHGNVNKTVWNLVVDIRALFNWAIKHGLARENPVNKADLSAIKNRKPQKTALDLNDVEFAARCLDGYDRVYFNFMRFTGLRMDEANRARWENIDFDGGWVDVRGTKTESSADIIPLAPVLRDELEKHRQNYADSELIFPGRSAQMKGKKIYSRRRFFEKIQKLTARIRYTETHPELTPMQVMKAVKKENYKGGVRLTAKDLRDVFATVMMGKVRNADTARRLMRHTSLQTTTKYTREVKAQMQDAVRFLGKATERTDRLILAASLGGKSGGELPRKTTRNDILTKLAIEALTARITRESVGGGGRSRTYDAADMSRVL